MIQRQASLTPLLHKTRYATKEPPHLQAGRNVEEEKKNLKKKLEADPEHVTTDSSTRKFLEPSQRPAEAPVGQGLKDDLVRYRTGKVPCFITDT